MGLLCLQNECIDVVNHPAVPLRLTNHGIKVAHLSWKSMYGKEYVPTLAAPFLKSQEKYQDPFDPSESI